MKPAVHFVGCGGIGMSSLMRFFVNQGWDVSGSDAQRTAITQELKKEGCAITMGHNPKAVTDNIVFVVYSQAISQSNPELERARELKLPILSYPETISHVSEQYTTIAIAGSHGKSTTTAFASVLLARAGLDPTVIIGTKLKEFKDKNFRKGKGQYLILEADEYKQAFFHYSPTFTIVTNIDREHLDCYENLVALKQAFLKFIANTKMDGALILNKDDKKLWSLRSRIENVAREKRLRISWYSLRQPDARKVNNAMRVPGVHNASNALAVFELAKLLSIPESKALEAITAYRGSWRRLELRGSYKQNGVSDIPVYDDYAHHPTEIKATLLALKSLYPNSKLICVFQPHLAKRLASLFKDFQSAFSNADALILSPLYLVTGRDKADPQYSSDKLASAVQKRYPKKQIIFIKDLGGIKEAVQKATQPVPGKKQKSPGKNPSYVIVMMGAGDIFTYTDLLLGSKRKAS